MMIGNVLIRLKEKKYIIQGLIILIIFLTLYTMLDYFNGGYHQLRENFSFTLVLVNITLNVIMSILSALMMNISSIFLSFSKREGKGSLFSAFSVLFGMLTYGCTPCVIAFFASIGITFSVAVLPLAGLPYKLISLIILIVGLFWLLLEIRKFRCKINLNREE